MNEVSRVQLARKSFQEKLFEYFEYEGGIDRYFVILLRIREFDDSSILLFIAKTIERLKSFKNPAARFSSKFLLNLPRQLLNGRNVARRNSSQLVAIIS